VKGFIEDEGYGLLRPRTDLRPGICWKKQGTSISLVVTDIEMPNLDGFGLAERIKSDERYRHLPVIALTTLAEDDDIARGRKAGIDDYQIKLDREKLMESIDRFMKGKLTLGRRRRGIYNSRSTFQKALGRKPTTENGYPAWRLRG
jgi:two-component system chemotaxis sensor kinase CheA